SPTTSSLRERSPSGCRFAAVRLGVPPTAPLLRSKASTPSKKYLLRPASLRPTQRTRLGKYRLPGRPPTQNGHIKHTPATCFRRLVRTGGRVEPEKALSTREVQDGGRDGQGDRRHGSAVGGSRPPCPRRARRQRLGYAGLHAAARLGRLPQPQPQCQRLRPEPAEGLYPP